MRDDAAVPVHLEIDGPIATITNDNPDKHNAFDDDMDAQLFAVLEELRGRSDVRAVVWRGEGRSFSSGRDVSAIYIGQKQPEPGVLDGLAAQAAAGKLIVEVSAAVPLAEGPQAVADFATKPRRGKSVIVVSPSPAP